VVCRAIAIKKEKRSALRSLFSLQQLSNKRTRQKGRSTATGFISEFVTGLIGTAVREDAIEKKI